MKELLLEILDFVLNVYCFFILGVSSIVSFVVVYAFPKIGIIALIFTGISIVIMSIRVKSENKKE